MKSLAWRSLSPNGRAAYLEVGYGFEGENNGRILLSTQMLADRMGRDKSTAARALRELVCKGFVECVSKGGFSLKLPHASEWRLAAFKCDVTGALATKAFMRWQPENPERGGTGEARGGTGATDSQKATRNSPSQWHGCNREGRLAGVSGGTGATHLSSNHMGSVSESAQRGDAARPVQAPASVNSGPFEPDTFTDIHGAARRSYGSPQELIGELRQMSPAARQDFAKGARDSISEIMGSSRNDAAAARRELMDKGWNREKLQILIGKNAAAELDTALTKEAQRSQAAQNILGNSRTALRQNANKAFPGANGRDVDVSTSFVGLGLQFGKAALNKLNGNRRAELSRQAADLLTRKASDVEPLLREAQRRLGRRLNVREQVETVASALAYSALPSPQ